MNHEWLFSMFSFIFGLRGRQKDVFLFIKEKVAQEETVGSQSKMETLAVLLPGCSWSAPPPGLGSISEPCQWCQGQ